MKGERKFTWCVQFRNVESGDIEYRVYSYWSTREIKDFVADFVTSHKGYIVRIFKNCESL